MDNQIFIILITIFCICLLTITAITIFFTVTMNKKDKQFAEERKDYLNRIMAKNTQEYVKLNKSVQQTAPILTDGEILGDDRFDGILN